MLASLLALSTLVSVVSAGPQPIQKRAVQVINNCIESGTAAVTFDDGMYIYESSLSDQFNGAGAKATFFVNGNNYQCIYDRADELKALHAAGHTLGSHTWSHAHLSDLSWDQIHDELYRVEEAFVKILGVKPLYFRPPYGDLPDLAIAALENRGYKKAFLWNQDAGDANGASVQSQKDMYDGIAPQYPSPQLILQHSVIDSTPTETIPYAISKLQSAGYRLVAVDTCLGSSGEYPYQYVGEPQERDDSWHC